MTFIDIHKKDFLDCVNIIEKRMLKNLRDHPVNFIDFMHNSLNETSNLNEFKEDTLTISRSAGPAGFAIKLPVFESYLFPLLKVL